MKIWKWFQPAYNKIDEWDVPWLRDLCKGIWGILPNTVKKYLFAFIMEIKKKYGDEMAEKLMKMLKEFIESIVGKKEDK